MTELSLDARNLMARFFGSILKTEVTSHEPHDTLNSVRAAYDECVAAGLLKVVPFNSHGSITITPTPAGQKVAKDRYREWLTSHSDLFKEPVF